MRLIIWQTTAIYIILSAVFAISSDNLGLRLWCGIGLVVFTVNCYLKPRKLTRYAKLKRNGGTHSKVEWLLLCFYYGNRCANCHRRKKLTKDHIIPVSKGGTDHIKNIQPLCQSCNSSKSTKIIVY